MNRRRSLWAVGILAALLLGWAALERLTAPPKNIILITLDTTRADALGAYGRKDVATPQIDQLAAQGHLFEQAYAHAPITLPSHTSLLTGLAPQRHGVKNNISYRLKPEHQTLAEILQEAGFSTAAFVSSVILDSRFGLNQGFDLYQDDITHYTELTEKAIVTRRAAGTVDLAIDWLQQRAGHPQQPFFGWLHLYDAHYPYDPPLPYKQAYAATPYLGEIAYMDQQLGRLIATLRKNGQLDNTLIVLTADHGESFGAHGEATHGFFCYAATTHVPLLLSKPLYGAPGRRYAHPVQTVDIMPSILEWLGLEPPPELDGQLLSDIRPRSTLSEASIPQEDFYLAPLHGLRDGLYSFYLSSSEELYDLTQDPQEQNNLAGIQPELASSYRDRLQQQLDAASTAGIGSASALLDQATIERLRGLGYIADGGTAGASTDDPYARPSPLQSIDLYRKLQALRRFEDDYPFKLIEGLQELLSAHPDQIILRRDLGRLLVFAGVEREGIEQLRRAAELAPSDPRLHTFLGLAYHQFGRFEESLAEYEVALQLNPQHLMARYNMGLAQLALDKVEAARESFEQVLMDNPEDVLSMNNLAYLKYHHDRDGAGALELIQRALALDPELPLLKSNLERFSRPADPGL